jgi:GT2 family glycosyltransferase/ubiquinone/menaquinone biosynthesis C-methylase UbiE
MAAATTTVDSSQWSKEIRPVAAIINYNHPEKTLSLVQQLLRFDSMVKDGKILLVIVDTGSKVEGYDWLCEQFKKLGHAHGVMVRFDRQINYAHACNYIWRNFPKASSYFYLNNDLVVQSPVLTKMLEVMESEQKIGIVVPLTNTHGHAQNINRVRDRDGLESLPEWKETDYLPNQPGVRPSNAAVHQFDSGCRVRVEQGIIPAYVESPTVAAFSCVGIRREVLESIGGQDELLPYGLGADDDFCLRATGLQWKIVTALNTFVGHEGKASLSREDNMQGARRQAQELIACRWPSPKTEADDLISVIVPAYNCGRYLWNCLRSLLLQTHQNREIIVVDDGSTDDTQEVLRHFNVIKLQNNRNMGSNPSRNKGFAVSRGKYVVFCDSDAIYYPPYLEKLLAGLTGENSNEETGYSYADFRIKGILSGIHHAGQFYPSKLVHQNFVAMPMLIKREVFPGFDIDVRRHQDWDLVLDMLEAGYAGYYVQEELFAAFRRAEGISSQGKVGRIMSANKIREKHNLDSISCRDIAKAEKKESGEKESITTTTTTTTTTKDVNVDEGTTMVADVGGHWGKRLEGTTPQKKTSWWQSPTIRAHVNRLITGQTDTTFLQHFRETYDIGVGPKYRIALSLGSGMGNLERLVIQNDMCKLIVGMDVSQQRVEAARKKIPAIYKDRISYVQGDLNQNHPVKVLGHFPDNSFDLIFAKMIFHHIENLEELFEEISRVMTPHGFLYVDDFVGPARRQWTDAQLSYINAALEGLPEELRIHAVTGKIKESVEREDPQKVKDMDPSECVRSDEIPELLYQYFDVIRIRGYGGPIYHPLFDAIIDNFDESNGSHVDFIQRILDDEEMLINKGALEHDFVAMIARNK